MTNFLQRERLIIRSWIPDQHTEQLFAIYNDNDPEVIYFLGSAARPFSIRDA
jgi:hypothetical protein